MFNRDVFMSNFNLTIEDIEQQTGLSRKYIDRCYARFGSLLTGYRKQSPEQNKYLYDGNAVAIFLQIRHFKDRGMKLPEIRDRITDELGSRDEDMGSGEKVIEKELESSRASTPSADTKTFIAALKDAYEMAITSERSKVLMLTEAAETQKKREQEYINKIATFQATTKRRGDLLARLEGLEGKWFSGKKKKRDLINEIRRIDSETENAPVRNATDDDSGNPVGA